MALNLPPIKPGTRIVNSDGTATRDYSIWWQRVTDAIRSNEATQDSLIEAIVFTLTQAGIALAAAQVADAKAGEADVKAVEAAREAARLSSYPLPTNVVSAADAGASCTITIAPHERVYPVQGDIDVPDLTLTGGSITGLPYSATLHVYYDDASLANPTPTFATTADPREAQVGAGVGRHWVGVVTTPAAGSPPSTGGGGYPPGGGGGNPIP